ncbi:MAG: formate--tetrahydrofolate ligase [Lactobacillus iners]|nr:formate--tetrahydrofolate ligase [Lactobacillus iners]
MTYYKIKNVVRYCILLATDAVVVVATVRALKHHGKGGRVEAVKTGFSNLYHHIQTMKQYGVPVFVAINRFTEDTEEELHTVQALCQELGVSCHIKDSKNKNCIKRSFQ